MPTTRLLWLDLETTGLNPADDDILEIGLVVTDGLRDVLDERSIVIKPWLFEPADLEPDVCRMHEQSGLLDAIETHGVPLDAGIARAQAYLDCYFGIDWRQTITVGGSGIDRFDIPFLNVHAPDLARRFYYGTLDTSGIKRISRLAGRELTGGANGAGHRAVADALDSFRMAQAFAKMLEPVILTAPSGVLA
jgi:oligoribonuclease